MGFLYPFFEGIAWNGHFGIQAWLKASFGAEFHDFAGSVVVHAMGGWIALAAVLLLGARRGRYTKEGRVVAFPPSNIPFLALGAWVLSVGWFGFNVMSAQTLDQASPDLVAANSLMAMAGGTIAGLFAGRNDPGFVHNGPLAGLVAICAGSDVMHPLGALARVRWPAGSSCGCSRSRRIAGRSTTCWAYGRCTACAAPGAASRAASSARRRFGGLGGVAFASQLLGTALAIVIALAGGFAIYGTLRAIVGIRLDPEQEFDGADISIHRIAATTEHSE